LISAFIASTAAALGGSQRDEPDADEAHAHRRV
jgi:hypothetical protein